MLFNSLQFAVFFFVVTALYFLLPPRQRWVLLLGASCYFYMAFVPVYILILAFTIVVDYVAGRWIECSTGRRRRMCLLASLVANIGTLAFFKYFNFLNHNLTTLLGWGGLANPIPHLNIILPIGLSFHTFQAMSYTIEVYRGRQPAERHFGIYALYVMFYPQLVAGPIERPQNLLHQFRQAHRFNYARITDGLRLMGWGLFKKVVVADRLAEVVDRVYAAPGQYPGLGVALATFFFAYQIYCDFSGYSDMALGAARVMGFDLMRNFRRPYGAANIQEFWRCWHISLSSWFRDYLYFPLGGSRVSRGRLCANVLIVFTVSGLWHGANWTFVIWGVLHGLFMLLYLLVKANATNARDAQTTTTCLRQWLARTATFGGVCLAWVFFRADSPAIAWECLGKVCGTVSELAGALFHQTPLVTGLDLSPRKLGLMLSLIALLEALEWAQLRCALKTRLARAPWFCRWAAYYALLTIIVTLGVFEKRQFIYFQF
jgi:D-alanyl-lipoteichoic acid acyltransferase DltB (MBOAT superfamily)